MNNYRRGYEIERRAMNELTKDNWLAIRAAGSHGPFDVWALKDKLLLIQLKRAKSGGSYSRVFKELAKIHVPIFAEKWLWCWTDRKGWQKYRVN